MAKRFERKGKLKVRFMLALARAAGAGGLIALIVAIQVGLPSRLASAEPVSVCRERQGESVPLSTQIGWFTDAAALADRPLTEGVPAARRRFCAQGDQDFIDRLATAGTVDRMGFENPGGDLGTGLCWMHSRFQRALVYLADFHPEQEFASNPAEADRKADQIIDALIHGNEVGSHVVVIPGFFSIYDFTLSFKDKIARKLNQMAYQCVFVTHECLDRLGDRGEHATAAEMRATIDRLAEAFWFNGKHRRSITFARMKAASFAPFVSHSALILGMRPFAENRIPRAPEDGANYRRIEQPGASEGRPVAGSFARGNQFLDFRPEGYDIIFTDPNYPGVVYRTQYHDGMTALDYEFEGKAARISFYPDYDEDLGRFEAAFDEYCRPAGRAVP